MKQSSPRRRPNRHRAAAREHVHLIGIGGTGMTGLAGLLLEDGCRVSGSDGPLYPPTSTILERLELHVHAGFDPRHLRPAPDLVVVGNAISRGNPELEEVLDRGLPYTSMPRLIGERFLMGRQPIVVAGTHGKTTTTSMLAWLLERAGHGPGFLIGGLPRNFDLPFRLGRGPAFVIEGDEYDSAFFDKGPKFMHYRPSTVVLGSIEFDHADIYRDAEQVRLAFHRLVRLVPRRGLLLRDVESAMTREASEPSWSRVEEFGLRAGDWRAEGLEETPTGCRFRLLRAGADLCEVRLAVAGRHNAKNAIAAAAAAHDLGLSPEQIGRGLAEFEGVRRRLELRGTAAGVRVFDDFAHHPTAIQETLRAVRQSSAGARVWAILEPRSWSMRRNVFQQRLVKVFDDADEIVIAEVFRGEAIPDGDRLDVPRLVEELGRRGRRARHLPRAEAIARHVAEGARRGDVIVVMSNGGFEGLHERLLELLGALESQG